MRREDKEMRKPCNCEPTIRAAQRTIWANANARMYTEVRDFETRWFKSPTIRLGRWCGCKRRPYAGMHLIQVMYVVTKKLLDKT